MFEEHYKGLKDAGIKVGAYLYSYCSNVNNAVLEAQNCLEFIKGKEFDLPIFYDLEDKITKILGKKAITQIAINFCKEIEKAGYKAGVYANLDWFKNYIDVYSLIDEHYKIWLAQWEVEKPTCTFPYQFWQFTNHLHVAGLSIDGNFAEEKEITKTVENVDNFVEKSKSIEELAIEVINGKYGNGLARKQALGENYEVIQEKVNKILQNNDIDEIVLNVIKGKYGNGQARKDFLGVLYNQIQDKVNKLMRNGR